MSVFVIRFADGTYSRRDRCPPRCESLGEAVPFSTASGARQSRAMRSSRFDTSPPSDKPTARIFRCGIIFEEDLG